MALITLDNVSVTYQGSTKSALREVSLMILQGRSVLIQGESGHGKTTLGYVIQGVFPSLIQGKMEGEVCYNPNMITQPNRDIGMCFKDPNYHLSMIKDTVFDELAFVCENHGMAKDEISFRVKTIARLCDLEHVLHNAPQNITMSEKQRLAIGSLLCFDVDTLIFDEPLIYFDCFHIKWFLHLIEDLKKQGKTIILLDHHVEHYDNFIDDVIVLSEGNVVFSGTIQEGWSYMLHSITSFESLTRFFSQKTKPIRNLDEALTYLKGEDHV